MNRCNYINIGLPLCRARQQTDLNSDSRIRKLEILVGDSGRRVNLFQVLGRIQFFRVSRHINFDTQTKTLLIMSREIICGKSNSKHWCSKQFT